jgi:hypothetical protein
MVKSRVALVQAIKQAVPSCHLMMGDSPSLGKILGTSRQALDQTGLAAAARRGGVDQGYVTMALKNWNGVVVWDGSAPFGSHPSAMEGSHRSDLGQKMADLHKALPAHLTLLDGIIGMEGQGPHAGSRVDMNCIVASRDFVCHRRPAVPAGEAVIPGHVRSTAVSGRPTLEPLRAVRGDRPQRGVRLGTDCGVASTRATPQPQEKRRWLRR